MGASASRSFKKNKRRISSVHDSNSFKTEEVGERKTTSFRVKFKGNDNEAISPW